MLKRCPAFAALLLAACQPAPEPANPALWRVDGPHGQRAWLFGTIHTLARPAHWQTATVTDALTHADRLIVEVAALNDTAATAKVFAQLARTPGQPPLSQRLPPEDRPALARLLATAHAADTDFAQTETWAAAITLANSAEGEAGAHPEWGIDRQIITAANGKPVEEFEGAARQLATFDRLPESAQRRLLHAAVADAGHAAAQAAELAAAWRTGDVARIGRETTSGMLLDPTLREALYAARNRAWLTQLAATMARGSHPFVAVGAAHLAGPDGLPSLFTQQGYTVTRVE
ncbi:MAG: TraB/GumN family protein [Sphingomonadales bacterium]|nr:TraB/GumN family protein [Sphingomonadales bacterium]